MRRSFRSRRACATVAASAVLGLGLHAQAANLLINPGFEAPTEAAPGVNSDCAGWNFVLDCQRENFANHTPGGTYSIWAKTFEPAGGGITQNVNVVSGTAYNFTSNVFFEATYPTTSAQIQLGLIWQDSGGGNVGTPTSLNIDPTSNPPTGSWQTYTFGGMAPAGATQVQVSLGWSGGGTVPGSQSVFFDDADLEGAGTPPTNSIWITNGSGDFNISGNWANGVVPSGVGAEADFFGAITADHTVFSDIGITAGTLNFNNAKTYVIAGAGSLTMQVSTGSAQIIVQQGTQKLNIPTTIASNTVFNVSGGANLIVADPLTINSGKTVTQTGAGTVTYQSIVNVLGGGGIAFGNSTHAHELDVAATGTASIGGSSSVLTVDNLANAGKIDVKSNTMVVAYGNAADPSSSIRSQLTSGYANGAWNGNGINSSSATPRIGVGWKDDTAGKSVKVKYTYYGDANVDGIVNTADFTSLSQNFNAASTNAIWANGDFNYDGKVNALDFNAIAANFGATPIPGEGLGSLVPEPTSVLIALPLLALAARRRRST